MPQGNKAFEIMLKGLGTSLYGQYTERLAEFLKPLTTTLEQPDQAAKEISDLFAPHYTDYNQHEGPMWKELQQIIYGAAVRVYDETAGGKNASCNPAMGELYTAGLTAGPTDFSMWNSLPDVTHRILAGYEMVSNKRIVPNKPILDVMKAYDFAPN
ncbi:MAG: hypothetical protein ABIC95_06600 [archaeon]